MALNKHMNIFGSTIGIHTIEYKSNELSISLTTFHADLNVYWPVPEAVQHHESALVEISIC